MVLLMIALTDGTELMGDSGEDRSQSSPFCLNFTASLDGVNVFASWYSECRSVRSTRCYLSDDFQPMLLVGKLAGLAQTTFSNQLLEHRNFHASSLGTFVNLHSLDSS
jgi:hypothetical protein